MFYYYFIEPHYVAWTGLEPLHSQLVLKLGSSCLSFKRTGVTVYITPGSLNYSRENFSQGALCPPKTSMYVYTICNKYILLLNQVQPLTSSVFLCYYHLSCRYVSVSFDKVSYYKMLQSGNSPGAWALCLMSLVQSVAITVFPYFS